MANKTLTTQIILRNGTTSEWEASTKILKLGEVGIDTTKNEIRIGDGEHTWEGLKIAGADQAAIQALIDQAEDKGDGSIVFTNLFLYDILVIEVRKSAKIIKKKEQKQYIILYS